MAIMYFLLIRPQQQQAKKLREKINAVRRGDTVVTAGGILGRVVKAADAEDPEILVEIADNVQVKVLKATLSDVRAKSEPAEADKSLMLQVSPFTRILVALIVLGGILVALPNALPDRVAGAHSVLAAAQYGQPGTGSAGRLLPAAGSGFRPGAEGQGPGDDRRYPRRVPQGPYSVSGSRRQWRHGAGARHRSWPPGPGRAS